MLKYSRPRKNRFVADPSTRRKRRPIRSKRLRPSLLFTILAALTILSVGSTAMLRSPASNGTIYEGPHEPYDTAEMPQIDKAAAACALPPRKGEVADTALLETAEHEDDDLDALKLASLAADDVVFDNLEGEGSIDPNIDEIEIVDESEGIAKGNQASAERDREEVDTPTEICGFIKRGNTVSGLLNDYLDKDAVGKACNVAGKVYPLSKIRVGRPWKVVLEDETFARFEYEIDEEEMLVLRVEEDGFRAEREALPVEVVTSTISGRVETSLSCTLAALGEPTGLAALLADIFAWDIDFGRDVRVGDTFTCVVDKLYRDDEFLRYGEIKAARYENGGRIYEAFRYETEAGNPQYYDGKGRNLRRAFLKTPVAFTRISSGFSLSRLHPILKVRRPHPGYDYAAPVGTPVKAVGDGTILRSRRDRYAGRYVKIRHNSVYETTYMHLSRFGRGVKEGRKVRQGQVIGYVGSSGLSTGPHLDFRMKKHGSYVDHRKITSPASPPVPKSRLSDFLGHIAPFTSLLDQAAAAAPLHAAAPLPAGKLVGEGTVE
jgi:murein DD-endopeptidase MepM/ murein hydrolase activator NlpD